MTSKTNEAAELGRDSARRGANRCVKSGKGSRYGNLGTTPLRYLSLLASGPVTCMLAVQRLGYRQRPERFPSRTAREHLAGTRKETAMLLRIALLCGLLSTAMMSAACGTSAPSTEQTAPTGTLKTKRSPVALQLGTYHPKIPLRTITVSVRGKARTFVLDTGAGVTVVSPTLAAEMGCNRLGHIVGHRAEGQRLDFPRCTDVTLDIGGATTTDVGIFDLRALLPAGFPPVDGVVSLASFEGRAVTVQPRSNRLWIETPASLRRRISKMSELVARHSRSAGGLALTVFFAFESTKGRFWLKYDTGNLSAGFLAPAIARRLGLVPSDREITSAKDAVRLDNVSLAPVGAAPLRLPMLVKPCIYDGLLGVPLVSEMDVTLDLRNRRAWLGKRR